MEVIDPNNNGSGEKKEKPHEIMKADFETEPGTLKMTVDLASIAGNPQLMFTFRGWMDAMRDKALMDINQVVMRRRQGNGLLKPFWNRKK